MLGEGCHLQKLSMALLHSFGCMLAKMADLRAAMLLAVAYPVTLVQTLALFF